ncbi:MAG: hypothetical protein KA152_14085, partial [Verrucomicrobiales bacterium]|nr:hypothetical protein [Verrucomicrobiales bacterium]
MHRLLHASLSLLIAGLTLAVTSALSTAAEKITLPQWNGSSFPIVIPPGASMSHRECAEKLSAKLGAIF